MTYPVPKDAPADTFARVRLFGSVIYKEYGSDEIKLNMFSAECCLDATQEILTYQQEPMS